MATFPPRQTIGNGYPTASKEPRIETDWHRDNMARLIELLQAHFAGQNAYVSGNLLVFYQRGNKRRRVAPDVWLAREVENHLRRNFLIWQELRGPEFIIELTSSRTRHMDTVVNFRRYREVLKVREYFLFDPLGDYLDPRLQGYRLRGGAYQRIHERNGRLPSQVTGLHLEVDGDTLRLWNPETEEWLQTRAEAAEERADAAEAQAEAAEARAQDEADRRRHAEAEVERLRQEIEQLRSQNRPDS